MGAFLKRTISILQRVIHGPHPPSEHMRRYSLLAVIRDPEGDPPAPVPYWIWAVVALTLAVLVATS